MKTNANKILKLHIFPMIVCILMYNINILNIMNILKYDITYLSDIYIVSTKCILGKIIIYIF